MLNCTALLRLVGCCVGCFFVCLPVVAQEATMKVAAQRKFKFTYAATIEGIRDAAEVRVWMPVAQTNPQQQVKILHKSLPSDADASMSKDKKFGNQILHVGFKPTEPAATIGIDFSVVRHEVKAREGDRSSLTAKQKELFLAANRMVPLTGKPSKLIKKDSLASDSQKAGRQLYDLVEQHMKYDKSKPGYGKGDVLWACDSRTGNCTDFHSLFISLARMNSIPARFEIGFPLPADKRSGSIKGYHCWAWFHAKENGWIPVDISEADKHPEMRDYYFGNLTPDRVAFTTGRDIQLEPRPATAPTLNYFVFPFVEVDGKAWPKEKIKMQFSFAE